MTNENYLVDDFEVDLKDLLMRILLGWRRIIVWMLVGAIFLGSIGVLRSYQQKKAESMANSDGTEAKLASLKESLSKRECIDVEDTLDVYLGLWGNYKNLLDYQENSLKMQLDPAQVIRTTIWYRVDNHFQVEYPVVNAENNISDIVFSYSLAISDIAFYKDVLALLDLETTADYIRELVQIDSEMNDRETGIFSVSVLSSEPEIGEAILDAVTKKIKEQTPKLQLLYGGFEIMELERQVNRGLDQKLLREQMDQEETLSIAANLYRNLSSYMTPAQKSYYEALIEAEVEEMESEGDSELESVVTEGPKTELFQVKYILLGAALGAFLACAWELFRYLFSRRLRVTEDLERGYRIPVLGVFSENANGKKRAFEGVDRWLRSLFYREYSSTDQVMALVISQIKTSADRLGLKALYITGTGSSEENDKVRDTLCHMLQKEGIEVSQGASVVRDSQSLERMIGTDGVVFVEEIGESRYDDLKEEAVFCQRYRIPVLGCVVLQ